MGGVNPGKVTNAMRNFSLAPEKLRLSIGQRKMIPITDNKR